MSLINSFTHIQENWKFVIICVQNQWGVVHPWHGTVANLWGRHKDFTEFNENFEKSYLLNGLSNIVKFFTVWFLKIFCITWIHIFFWVQCSFKNIYCKSGNICGALIFANFAQNSASMNSKTHQKCDILYAHFGHVVVVYWPCVLMQMGNNILENVWGLLCFCAAQLLGTVSYCMMSSICAIQKMSSEHLLSANLTTREYVFVLPNAKN